MNHGNRFRYLGTYRWHELYSFGLVLFFYYSPCLGYNCMKYASCMDVSTEKGPNTTCVCQLARIMNEDRTEVGTFLYETDQFLRY